ncbi:MAG: NAD(P)/FAD-dependent oxidoreductase [Erysipelotrichaceae bacterium]
MYDIIIIGAGIIGSFLAHDLAHYHLKVAVLEKENDVGNKTSMANSAIIHAGYDPKDNTLKAQLNVQGSKMYEEICKGLQVPYNKCGSLLVAQGKDEEEKLEQLYQQARSRNVNVAYLSGDEARLLEPQLSDAINKALIMKDTAIINPMATCIALIEEAIENGVELFLEQEVKAIEKQEDVFVVKTVTKNYQTRLVIEATGVYGDHVAGMIETKPNFKIIPKKGQYYVLSKDAGKLIHHVIYPIPSSLGKGVLAIPTIDGNLLIGPTNEISDVEDVSTSVEGLSKVKQQISHILKPLPMQEVIREFSGLRPSGNDGDFLIEESKTIKNLIHVACIDSPGLASAPAISSYVIETLIKEKLVMEEKDLWIHRRKPIVMNELSFSEKQEMIKKDARYGNIICRCEKISEGEIVDAIHRPCGARSIKGIKKRVRPGMGRCQGGFCEVEIRNILAKEYYIDPISVPYDASSDSQFSHPKGVK